MADTLETAKQTAPAPQPTPLEWSQLPEWLQGTWRESGYDLMMDDGDCCREQISLDRKEYLAMKLLLAQLRAIPLTPEQIEDLDNDNYSNDPKRTKLAAA